MKTGKTFRMAVFGLIGCVAQGAWAEGTNITSVVVRQRWPWSPLVDVDYVLDCEDAHRVDVAVSAYCGTTPVILPVDSLSGDLYNVSRGARRIVVDPSKTSYTNGIFTTLKVDVSPTPIPLYMVIDLMKDKDATNQITYVYPGDAKLETYGRWTNVWFGVTNSEYKTDKLVLRRVPAGSFMMGEYPGNRPVTLTKACYVGVFELTDAQWYRIMGTGNASSSTPKIKVSYNMLRGATNGVPAVNWYTTGSDVCPTSFIGCLRTKTGIDDFDLPTDAQWEYCCRAGTQSYYSDGVSTSAADTNILNEIGWWKGNGGITAIQHPVGEKAPNAWGLYDTHGNVWEICLDWYVYSLGTTPVTDPPGPASGEKRVARSGTASLEADGNRTAVRGAYFPDFATDPWSGVRLVRTLK